MYILRYAVLDLLLFLPSWNGLVLFSVVLRVITKVVLNTESKQGKISMS